ncbi:uncharacterized protein B0I36DRAFT_334080 [Microdochium trichocladiopsis]|uniref:Pentatricopeptide repeat protein n=1 Tax=Microdochium trichocladiopsis TaxID=1682393 RepID=A0A9P9BI55_9PEZI|nr:uncharacterized protein B0I36DRAFT_334080 [Microdochium trichocladiopsis]KAH7021235.1 hypothetical protein B0I36DRAFT_334080 [Microdochium trichocladiopsis]
MRHSARHQVVRSLVAAGRGCTTPPAVRSGLVLGRPPTQRSSDRGTSMATTSARPLAANFFTRQHPITARRNHAAHAAASSPIYNSRRPSDHREHQLRHHPLPRSMPSTRELLDFVDYIDDDTVEDHLEFLNDPYRHRHAVADGPNITISDDPEDVNMQSYNQYQVQDPDQMRRVEDLADGVLQRLSKPNSITLDEVWALYQSIPQPRVSPLPASLRHALLAALGRVSRKNYKNMLRYLAVIGDVKTAGFALQPWEWNTAMSFASRYVATTSAVELESAIRTWEEMERVSGVTATDVTFNILFDAASKAGCFSLAEMLYEEMLRRHHRFSRYHHVTLIHFFGLKGDSSGIRAAYREMVRSGEIIDSIVLNCVIAGLLRCGEESSAMEVYEKMKARHIRSKNIPDRNYRLQKSITKVLMMFAKVGKTYPDMHPNFQKSALLAPDFSTYRIMINHYGVVVGDLSKVAQFLDEMKWFRVPLHGAIFLALFKGFSVHGGESGDWTAKRLQSVWEAFQEAMDTGAGGLHISTWMAMYILRAFSLVSTREEMLDIYEALRSRWDLDAANTKFMLDFFGRLVDSKKTHALKGLGTRHTYLAP